MTISRAPAGFTSLPARSCCSESHPPSQSPGRFPPWCCRNEVRSAPRLSAGSPPAHPAATVPHIPLSRLACRWLRSRHVVPDHAAHSPSSRAGLPVQSAVTSSSLTWRGFVLLRLQELFSTPASRCKNREHSTFLA